MKIKKRIMAICVILAVFFVVYASNNKNSAVIRHKEVVLSSKQAIKVKIMKEAQEQGLSPILALSVARQESDFEKTAKSYVGAIGIFQLMPATAKDLGVNPYYTNENIKGGIKYLKALKNQFGSTKLALAAYNAGPGAVQRYNGIPPYRETRIYVKNILNYYKYYNENPDAVMLE